MSRLKLRPLKNVPPEADSSSRKTIRRRRITGGIYGIFRGLNFEYDLPAPRLRQTGADLPTGASAQAGIGQKGTFFKGLKLSVLIVCLVLASSPDSCFSTEDRFHDYVVLIHGLSRTSKSFQKMENHLKQIGFDVLNIDYPSRKYDIQTLTSKFIRPAIQNHCTDKEKKIHFVTHSMGGIIVRYYLKTYPMENIGRVVMLSPPNQGSKVVDFLKDQTTIRKIMGPAFDQLSTDPNGFVNTLGDVDGEVGIITGTRSINWINSIIIPGEDDGKVSVDRARLKNMKDFLVVKRTHPLIMNADEVLDAVVYFIENGNFNVPVSHQRVPTQSPDMFDRAEVQH